LKQYYEENNLLTSRKEYYENNKSLIAEKMAEKIDCSCGGCYTRGKKSSHFKTFNHQKYAKTELL